MTTGFHWFVAWRYLMARPRMVSGTILVFVAVFLGVAVAAGFAMGLQPLTDDYIAAGLPVPAWLPAGFGAALGLSVLLPYAVAMKIGWLSRLTTPRWGRWAGGSLFAVALVTALLTRYSIDGVGPILGAALLFAPLVVIGAGATVSVSAIPWAVPITVALSGAAGIGQVAFASHLTEGELLANLPGLEELPLLSLQILLPALAALALLVAAVILPAWRHSGVRLAALAAALTLTGAAGVLWAHMADFGFHELGRPTTAIEYHLPIWLLITASIAAVLLVLSLILLGIRYFFTFFTTVSMGGVAIGSMALVITLSVMSGFENDLRSKILGSNAHLLVTREDEAPFEDYQEVMKQIAHVRDVQAVTPHLTSEVVIAGASNYWNVIIKGIDPDSVAEVTKLGKDLEDPASLEQLIPQLEPDDEAGVDPDRTEPDAPAEPESDPDLLDPAPEDLEVGDVGPIDLSGGLTDMPEDPEAPETEERELIIDSIEDPEDGWEPPPHPLAPEVAALPGVLVGRELVTQINLYTSQEVKVISPLGQNTVAGQTPYIKPYRVAGVFYTGMYEYDLKLVYVELSTLQDFLDLPDVASGIEIRVGNPARTESVLADLRELLGPTYQVRDWKELNRSLFSALKLEKIAMFLVLAIIILVASFSIVGNLIMVVIEKAREIAVLKTLGASDSGVTRVFIVQGFFIGVIGTTIGVSLGLGASYLLDYFGLPIPKDVYYIDRLPVHVDLVQVALVGLAGMAISVAATIYPARIAARLRPVQGLRYE